MSTPASVPPAPQGATRLTDWGVIRASGADARKFLHGQLSQDVEHLGADRARLAGYCSAKGRLLATFVVWLRAPDEVLLACSADLLPATLKRLSMFVLRARCKLTDASAELPLWGLAGDEATLALGAGAPAAAWERKPTAEGEVVLLPAGLAAGAQVPRYLWVGAEPPALPALDPDAWRWLEASSGVARVMQATVEQFVPQMVNLDLVGGVNFQKGCYPGQEVVARSQYRGTLKRRTSLFSSAGALAPGDEVFSEADPDQPAGMVVLSGTLPGGHHAALVEIKIAATLAGGLHGGSPTGPALVPGTLPYVIPAEAG
jgi:hypothetical protein